MHMPGHKRNTELLGCELPYGIDLTEIDGFDRLHGSDGILKEIADLASELYGSRRSFLLVNGSTGGILASVRAAVRYGDRILMARNCHQSVYHAAEVNGLKTAYLVPETDRATGVCGSIAPAELARALEEYPDTKLVVVTSPTYEGVISDVRALCSLAHRRNIPVLVDEAHGAHLGFSDYFPGEALKNGADLVVTGLHKTLPALTQCALAHAGGTLVDPARVARQLSVFETSSPSYILMASIDRCLELLRECRTELFNRYEGQLKQFDKGIQGLEKLIVLCHGPDAPARHEHFFGFDPGKIAIGTRKTDYTGPELAELLRSGYRIEPEMACADYVLCMTSFCDTEKNFETLARALTELDRSAAPPCPGRTRPGPCPLPEQEMPICRALELEGECLPPGEAEGAVSLEYVWAYPPGIPIIVPGERVDGTLVRYLEELTGAGVELHSSGGGMPLRICVKRLKG